LNYYFKKSLLYLVTVFGLFSDYIIVKSHAMADSLAPSSKETLRHFSQKESSKLSYKIKHRTWPGQGDPKVEKVRKCIVARESKGNYKIADPTGRWFGAYQFSLRTSNTAARRMNRMDLIDVPANEWLDNEQDAAFYVIYNKGKGRKHWANGVPKCI